MIGGWRPRYTEQLSVWELKKHWDELDALTIGQSLEAVPRFFLPPWPDLCSDLSWHTYLLGGGYFTKKDHGYRGVYRLIALSEAGNVDKPMQFNRVCGQDVTGTLYIGCAGRLNDRLNQMRRSEHHTIGMLRRIPALNLPLERLAIAMLFTGRSYTSVEGYLISAYINSFGDTPPLNYKL
jgi:hypothetical protein